MAGHDRIAFGAFELDRSSRLLTRHGRTVPISYRCLDALIVLADAGGAIVERDALLQRLWPDTFVEDSSLPQLMRRLRKTLSEFDDTPYIETIPKHGYRLAVPVTALPRLAHERPEIASRTSAIPTLLSADGRGRRRLVRWSAVAALALLAVISLPLARPPGATASDAGLGVDLLDARRLWHKRDDESLRQAQEIVSRVLMRDPESARAYALLADLMALRAQAGLEARTAAEKAIALDPRLAEGHASLGFVLMVQDWDWAGAGPLFEQAVALNPRLPHARQWLAVWRVLTGDVAGARDEIARARALDPLAAHLLAETAGIEYFGRDYREAIVWARRALAADPHFSYAYSWWSSAARQAGLDDEAFRVRANRITFLSRRSLDISLEQSLRQGGIPSLLSYEFRQIVPTPANAWTRAVLHARLGQHDDAIRALGEAVEHRNFLSIYLGAEPAFDAVRAHPAFDELLARVGLRSADR